MDKETEKRLTAAIRRGFTGVLRDLGFREKWGIRVVDGHTCQVWLQKFTSGPNFRVHMVFRAAGADENAWVYEKSDVWEQLRNPYGRQYKFFIPRRGDDPAGACLAELRDFVEFVAITWFDEQIKLARDAK